MTLKVNDIDIGKGRPELGAPEDMDVFVIRLGDKL